MRLDTKVHGILVKNKDGVRIPDDEFVVFRPHDDALLPALARYREVLAEKGSSPEQLAATDDLVERITKWRQDHPDRCKVPDVQGGELLTADPPPDENEDLVFYIRSFWQAIVSAPWNRNDLIDLGKQVYAKVSLSDVDEKLFSRLLPRLKAVASTFKQLVDDRYFTVPKHALPEASPAPSEDQRG